MKLLLDHCVPRRLARSFLSHEVRTAAELGWAGQRNGRLLKVAAEAGFEVFVTVDQNIRHQQNLRRLPVPVLELRAVSNDVAELTKLTPHVEDALERTKRFGLVVLHVDGRVETFAQRI